MAERLKAPHSKCGIGASLSGVRIPPSPPTYVCPARRLLQVEVTEIIVHKADEPNTVVDFLDSKSSACQHGRDVDLFAVQAEAPAGGGETLAVVEGASEVRQAKIKGFSRGCNIRPDTSWRVLHAVFRR